MSLKTNIKKGGKYRFTSDGLFAIEPFEKPGFEIALQNDSIYLYIVKEKLSEIMESSSALSNLMKNNFIVLDDLEPTKSLTMKVGGLDITNIYNKYKFHRLLLDKRKYDENGKVDYKDNSMNENDCLQFGECMTIANQTGDIDRFNMVIQSESTPPVLQFKHLENKQFGQTDKMNIKSVKQITESEKNVNAIPENGETYAIVRKDIVDDSAPFHIAFVLYRHQDINITLEASADAGAEYYPRFGFYDIKPNGLTFHKLFSQHYTNGETTVLKSRDMDTVLREIDDEIAKKNAKLLKKRKIGMGGTTKKRVIKLVKKKNVKKSPSLKKRKSIKK